jgi:hypothetical protein
MQGLSKEFAHRHRAIRKKYALVWCNEAIERYSPNDGMRFQAINQDVLGLP